MTPARSEFCKSISLNSEFGCKLLSELLALSPGTRSYKVALQVNPYSYILDNAKPNPYVSESEYNDAIVASLRSAEIDIAAVTDHHRISKSVSMLEALKRAGIVALPGFEAASSEGVHVLLVFEADTTIERVASYLGACGIHGDDQPPICNLSFIELLEKARSWDALAIAAHVVGKSGLLKTLQGAARSKCWRDQNLLASGIAGSPSDVPQEFRDIILNRDPQYKRDRPMAYLNVGDISSVADATKPGASTAVKLTLPTVSSLKQACLDPESRIRLFTEPAITDRTEIIGLKIEGGFLDGLALRLNSELNVLIGGRGTGKSTIIEAVRCAFALPAYGSEAQTAHDKLVKGVVRPGTRISIFIRASRPSPQTYLVQRSYPDNPLVFDEAGNLLHVSPIEMFSGIMVLGQHEIAEIAKQPVMLTKLLERYREDSGETRPKESETFSNLKRNRADILTVSAELETIEDRLAALPALSEKLRQFAAAGVEARLAERNNLIKEESVLKAFDTQLDEYEKAVGQLKGRIPLSDQFLLEESLKDLPFAPTLAGLISPISRINAESEALLASISSAIQDARNVRGLIGDSWNTRKVQVERATQDIFRALQAEKVDAQEYLGLKKRVQDLLPLAERSAELKGQLQSYLEERQKLRLAWIEIQRGEFSALEKAARKIGKKFAGTLRVRVTYSAQREELYRHLSLVTGRTDVARAKMLDPAISLSSISEAMSNGSHALVALLGCTVGQAERFIAQGTEWRLKIDEIELGSTTDIELNIGSRESQAWHGLDDLSTGQKATAVLLLVTTGDNAPLIIDQPEDDLDNRFISEEIVPRLRETKRKRQFLFATHNANIPVLADAEQIVGLAARGDGANGQVVADNDRIGSIDKPTVKSYVETVLEGGKAAFETRRLKYGFE